MQSRSITQLFGGVAVPYEVENHRGERRNHVNDIPIFSLYSVIQFERCRIEIRRSIKHRKTFRVETTLSGTSDSGNSD